MSKLNSTRKSSTLKTNQTTVGAIAGCVTDMAAAQTNWQISFGRISLT